MAIANDNDPVKSIAERDAQLRYALDLGLKHVDVRAGVSAILGSPPLALTTLSPTFGGAWPSVRGRCHANQLPRQRSARPASNAPRSAFGA